MISARAPKIRKAAREEERENHKDSITSQGITVRESGLIVLPHTFELLNPNHSSSSHRARASQYGGSIVAMAESHVIP
jgi:hypothetical protein